MRRGGGRARDSQRLKVYKTEWLLQSLHEETQNWSLGNLAALLVESWKVRGCDWDVPELKINRRLKGKCWHRPRWELSKSGDWAWNSLIELAPDMMHSVVLLHELTHAEMMPIQNKHRGTVASHGPLFVAKNATQMGKVLGPKVEQDYRMAALVNGVRVARKVA